MALPNGQILVGGNVDYGRDNPTLWRLNEDGGLDPSFGSGGRSYLAIGGEVQGASMAVDEVSGSYLLLGNQYDNWAVVSRFLVDGSLDSSFGSQGQVVVDGVTKISGRQLAADSRGRVVVVGSARPDGETADQDLALFRLLSDGTCSMARWQWMGSRLPMAS